MLKGHCLSGKYVIVPYGTIYLTVVTIGLTPSKPGRWPIKAAKIKKPREKGKGKKVKKSKSLKL